MVKMPKKKVFNPSYVFHANSYIHPPKKKGRTKRKKPEQGRTRIAIIG